MDARLAPIGKPCNDLIDIGRDDRQPLLHRFPSHLQRVAERAEVDGAIGLQEVEHPIGGLAQTLLVPRGEDEQKRPGMSRRGRSLELLHDDAGVDPAGAERVDERAARMRGGGPFGQAVLAAGTASRRTRCWD